MSKGIDTSKLMDIAIVGILAYVGLKAIDIFKGGSDLLSGVGKLFGGSTAASGSTISSLARQFEQFEQMTPIQQQATAEILQQEAQLPYIQGIMDIAKVTTPAGSIISGLFPSAGEMAEARTKAIVSQVVKSKKTPALRTPVEIAKDISMVSKHLAATKYTPSMTPADITKRQQTIMTKVATYGYQTGR